MSSGPQLDPSRGLEVSGVSQQERKVIQQAFANPLEIPPIFKGWLEAYLEPLFERLGAVKPFTASGTPNGKRFLRDDKTWADLPIFAPTHIGAKSAAAALSPVANTAYLMWIPDLIVSTTITRLAIGLNASSGNLDFGIYYSDDESTFTRFFSTGSFASPGAGFQIKTIGSQTIQPATGRRWYFAVAADNATVSFDTAGGLPGCYKKASSFPLPASLTGMSAQVRSTDGAYALIGMV